MLSRSNADHLIKSAGCQAFPGLWSDDELADTVAAAALQAAGQGSRPSGPAAPTLQVWPLCQAHSQRQPCICIPLCCSSQTVPMPGLPKPADAAARDLLASMSHGTLCWTCLLLYRPHHCCCVQRCPMSDDTSCSGSQAGDSGCVLRAGRKAPGFIDDKGKSTQQDMSEGTVVRCRSLLHPCLLNAAHCLQTACICDTCWRVCVCSLRACSLSCDTESCGLLCCSQQLVPHLAVRPWRWRQA